MDKDLSVVSLYYKWGMQRVATYKAADKAGEDLECCGIQLVGSAILRQ